MFDETVQKEQIHQYVLPDGYSIVFNSFLAQLRGQTQASSLNPVHIRYRDSHLHNSILSLLFDMKQNLPNQLFIFH
jgi:hypothetical protein